jgi:molecular chaperone HtpG
VNPRHDLVMTRAGGDDEQALRKDAAHRLLDEARILDGELPADSKAIFQRLARAIRRRLH